MVSSKAASVKKSLWGQLSLAIIILTTRMSLLKKEISNPIRTNHTMHRKNSTITKKGFFTIHISQILNLQKSFMKRILSIHLKFSQFH